MGAVYTFGFILMCPPVLALQLYPIWFTRLEPQRCASVRCHLHITALPGLGEALW